MTKKISRIKHYKYKYKTFFFQLYKQKMSCSRKKKTINEDEKWNTNLSNNLEGVSKTKFMKMVGYIGDSPSFIAEM